MDAIDRFRSRHASGTFVLPNPWDVGSARLLEALGFEALATTSSGLALAHGQLDGSVALDELAAHVRELTGAVALPLNVDAERLFGDDASGIAEAVAQLAEAGAAGLSIEDYDRDAGQIDDIVNAASRVRVAVDAAAKTGVVLTARAENLIRGVADVSDTLERLRAYRDAGAEVLYAPGLVEPADIEAAVAIGPPLNVLASPRAPSVPELAELGVRRVSIGGAFARAAYATLIDAATEVLEHGTATYQDASTNFRRSDELLG